MDKLREYLRQNGTSIFILIGVVFLISNASLSGYLVTRSFKAQTQRDSQVKREVETQEYIKCIVLLRFEVTPEQIATKEGAEKALDSCAGRE